MLPTRLGLRPAAMQVQGCATRAVLLQTLLHEWGDACWQGYRCTCREHCKKRACICGRHHIRLRQQQAPCCVAGKGTAPNPALPAITSVPCLGQRLTPKLHMHTPHTPCHQPRAGTQHCAVLSDPSGARTHTHTHVHTHTCARACARARTHTHTHIHTHTFTLAC